MRILTYATNQNNQYLKILRNKLNVEILPEIIPWESSTKGKYLLDFYPRIYSLREYIKNINSEELILVTDAYDVLPLNNCTPQFLEQTIIKCFNLKKITFCAEINCFPDNSLSSKYPNQNYHWKYLNAGIFTGKAKFLTEILNLTLHKIKESMDQLEFSKLFLERNLIDLDYHCNVFQSLFHQSTSEINKKINWNDFELKENIIKNKTTNTIPLLFHGNGGIDMSELLSFI